MSLGSSTNTSVSEVKLTNFSYVQCKRQSYENETVMIIDNISVSSKNIENVCSTIVLTTVL